MQLKSVEIENYRAIEKIDLHFDPQLTVLHGNNAHGKTSVLSAIALGLGAVPTLLPDVSGTGFLKKDRREGGGRARVSLTTTDEIRWERSSGATRRTGWFSGEDKSQEPPRHPLRDLKQWLESNALRGWGTPIDLPNMVIEVARFRCRNGRPETGFRDNRPSQGRILSRRQGRAGEVWGRSVPQETVGCCVEKTSGAFPCQYPALRHPRPSIFPACLPGSRRSPRFAVCHEQFRSDPCPEAFEEAELRVRETMNALASSGRRHREAGRRRVPDRAGRAELVPGGGDAEDDHDLARSADLPRRPLP